MTDETKRMAEKLAKEYASNYDDDHEFNAAIYFAGFEAAWEMLSNDINKVSISNDIVRLTRELVQRDEEIIVLCELSERLEEKLKDELDNTNRLTRIIAKELTENDELGCEYTYVNALRAKLSIATECIDKIDLTLLIPAAEYVSSIGDVFTLIDDAKAKLREE